MQTPTQNDSPQVTQSGLSVIAGSAVGHYPYTAALMSPGVWWPESSCDDGMVIGDQIPGDEKTARLCARYCNVAYRHALRDVAATLEGKGIDVSRAIAGLMLNKRSSDTSEASCL